MSTRHLPILIFLLSAINTHAQHVKLQGTVMDSITTGPLAYASVSLLSLPKKEPLAIKRSNNDGVFTFDKLNKGNYLLIVTYQGYAPDSTQFTVKPKDSAAIQIALQMQLLPSSLVQVVVEAHIPPAVVRNDTIAFNAAAYPTPPNSTLEDMLKKIPGIQIDKDGNVTMQGQKVDKITIGGKDFFLNDLRTATQTLSADLIAKVEVFDTQSEKAKRMGIKEDGKTKTINLVIKKNRRGVYTGKVYAGAGSKGSYSAGGDVTRLDSSKMLFAAGNANNINNQFTGSERQINAKPGLQTINNQQFIYRDDRSKKISATIDAGHEYNLSSATTLLNRQTALGDSSILQNSSSATLAVAGSYHANGQFVFNPDSSTRVTLISNFGHQQSQSKNPDTTTVETQKTVGNHLASTGKTINASSAIANTFSNNLDLSHNFKKTGRVLFLGLGGSISDQQSPAALFSLLKNYDSAGGLSTTLVNQQSNQKTTSNGVSLTAGYVEPIDKRHVLDFACNYNRTTSFSDKQSFAYDSVTAKYDVPDSLTTNKFLNHTTVQSLGAGYNKTEGRFHYHAELRGQFTQLDNLNQLTQKDFIQRTTNLIPTLSLRWRLRTGQYIRIGYTEDYTNPTIDQLQPVPDLTNPYIIKTGNPDLKQQLTHTANISYIAFNAKTFQNWQANVLADYARDQITSSSTLLAGGVQQLEYVNVAGVYHATGFLTYGFPLGGQKNGNASLGGSASYGHDISLVNGQSNVAESVGFTQGLNINFHVRDLLFIDAIANLGQRFINYSLPGSPPGQTLTQNYTLNVTYRLGSALTLASYYDLQVTGSQANLPAHAVSLWNAAAYRSIINNHCELRVSSYDMLNSSGSFTQTSGVNYTQTQQTNLRGRILLASIIYRFTKKGV